MANPVASLTNYIAVPADPAVSKDTWSRIVYEDESFFVYPVSVTSATYDPNSKGHRQYVFLKMENAGSKPAFITQENWDESVYKAPTGFVTSRYSIMPKLMICDDILVGNGSADQNQPNKALDTDGNNLFNWNLVSVNGAAIASGFNKYISRGSDKNEKAYISYYYKEKNRTADHVAVLRLSEPPAPKPDNTGLWISGASNQLVVTGAFCMMINLTPIFDASLASSQTKGKKWNVKFEFGDVTLTLNEGGTMEILIAGEENVVKTNLSDSRTKEGSPQSTENTGFFSYVFVVYPVWNGIIVSTGIQDTRQVVDVASQFCPKLQAAGIFNSDYSEPFDINDPDDVLVDVGSGSKNVQVDFGTKMDVTLTNCMAQMGYVPSFFSRRLGFDEWFYSTKNTATSGFSYSEYAIWTMNGVTSTLGKSLGTPVPVSTPPDIYEYQSVQWRLQQDLPNRWAEEIFGSYLKVSEEQTSPILNGNGSFELSWTGGNPGDPNNPGTTSPSIAQWTPYIQSISINLSLEDSSGSITLDKYGLAGQESLVDQDIGALTIDMNSGASGTTGGRIFSGIAMGIQDSQSSDGGTWTIPLVGLKKKLEEIILINPPFMDGYELGDALDFLTRYGGVLKNTAYADTGIDLIVSEDLSSPVYDWKTGTTSVLEALNQIMEDVLHTYYIDRYGTVIFYELDATTGLPMSGNWGPDREPSYPDTKIMSIDQTPDFEDIRNEIVVIAMQEDTAGSGTKIANLPLLPKIILDTQTTNPSFPWSRPIVKTVAGFVSDTEMQTLLDRIKGPSSVYETSGRTTVPGNANIRPFDQWGDYLIISVSHNIDFVAKSWTTDIEFASK